jgi:hypothetical protein
MTRLSDHQDFNSCAHPHYRVTQYGCGTGEHHLGIGRMHTNEAMVTVSHHLSHPDRVTVEIA